MMAKGAEEGTTMGQRSENVEHFADRGRWLDDERFVCFECWRVCTIDQAIVIDGDRYSTCRTCDPEPDSGSNIAESAQ